MESALADALIGRVLDRRYHVRSRIAHGGMATVYLATDTRLDRQVALKVMHAELARDQDFVTRFIGEAKSVARLSHPNIVAVFDQGADRQYLYLAMEYVPGRTLRSLLRERGGFSADAALGIIDPILSGLAAAHTAGIVHRDVKPENVLLTADGRLKVVDFGLAQAQATSGPTRAGVIIGTVAYIAPEQVTGHVTDFRTDVYAAGVLLFELLTGRQPHTGDSPLSVAYKHVNSDVPAPSQWVADIPPAMDMLVLAATSRDPRRRPADAGAFLRAVRAVRSGADPAAALEIAAGPASPGPGAVQPNTVQLNTAWPKSAAEGPASRAAVPPNTLRPNVVGTSLLAAPVAENHTMVVPGGYPADQGHHPSDPDYGYPAGPEPRLQRWMFSRRMAYAAAGAVALLIIVFAGWYLTSGQYTPVPTVAGLTESRAAAMLQADGFKVKVGQSVHDNTFAAGDVVSTSPSGRATSGATIVLTISSGPRMITIPPVTGHSLSAAIALLQQAGLAVSSQPQNVGAQGVPVGTVAGTNPPAGTSWPANKTVYVEVVAGQPVPNLIGQSVGAVQGWASTNGVNLVPNQVASDQPTGTIVAQSPQPGSLLTQGETITVSVSNGPAMVPVPNISGQQIDQASQALRGQGFKVHAIRIGFGKRVAFYSPTGQAPQGSTVTVYYGV
jgi:beta-lactam-binding protein with PASTA domain